MSFIRIKRIKGKRYAYLVENLWTSKGPRQKVSKYLGAAKEISAEGEPYTNTIENPENYFRNKSFKEITKEAIKFELSRRGFKETENGFEKDNIKITSDYVVTISGKNSVLRLNEGYFCNETVNELINYDGKDDPTGKKLARLIISCGIQPDEELFVELFAKSRPKDDKETAIYY